MAPRIASRAKLQQSLYFSRGILGVQIQVKPVTVWAALVSGLEREIGSFTAWITKDDPASGRGLSGHVVQRLLPEVDHSLELVTVDDDRANS